MQNYALSFFSTNVLYLKRVFIFSNKLSETVLSQVVVMWAWVRCGLSEFEC